MAPKSKASPSKSKPSPSKCPKTKSKSPKNRSKPCPSTSAAKTKAARRLQSSITTAADFPQILNDLIEALKGGRSPENQSKRLMEKMSEARRISVMLKEKDIPVYTVEEMNAISTMAERYGFKGRVFLHAATLSESDLADVQAKAMKQEIELHFM